MTDDELRIYWDGYDDGWHDRQREIDELLAAREAGRQP